MNRAVVVLVSGGLDSAVALAAARRGVGERGGPRAVHALTIDYGQRHRAELDAARRVAESCGAASHTILGLDLRAIGGSALTDDIDVPKLASGPAAPPVAGAAGGGEIPVTYVPARNLIFLSIAVALAEARGAAEVHLGVNEVDYSGYPDCRPEFIAAFQRAADLGTRAGVGSSTQTGRGGGGAAVRVVTPLIGMSKRDIIRFGASLGVDFSLTHSCYDPVAAGPSPAGPATGPARLACGRCDSCAIRARGFRDAGVPDPTAYAPGRPPAGC